MWKTPTNVTRGGVAAIGTAQHLQGHSTSASEGMNNQFNAKPSIHPVSSSSPSTGPVGGNKSRRYIVKRKK